MLVAIYYVKNSEQIFPYEVNGLQFDWDTFRDVQEKMTIQELLDIIF